MAEAVQPGPACTVELFKGHTDAVNSVHCSADGAAMVSGSDDRTVRLWDVRTRRAVKVFVGCFAEEVASVRFCGADCARVVAASGRSVALLDARADGVVVRSELHHRGGFADDVGVVAASEDGAWVAVADDTGGCTLLDGRDLGSPRQVRGVHSTVCSSALFVAGGASGGPERLWTAALDCTVAAWTVPACSKEWSHTIAASGAADAAAGPAFNPPLVHALSASPSGDVVAAALGDSTLALLSGHERAILARQTVHTGPVAQVCFLRDAAPDGQGGAALGTAGMDGFVSLWRAQGPAAAAAAAAGDSVGRGKGRARRKGRDGTVSAQLAWTLLPDVSVRHAHKVNWLDALPARRLVVADTSSAISCYAFSG